MRSLVPDRLRANWLTWYGPEQVAELVAGTHERAVAAIEQWGLDDVQPLGDGQVAVVCSCRCRGQPAVLKVSPRRRDQTHRRHETEALRLWTGLAPQVLAARDDGWTALLERVDPGVSARLLPTAAPSAADPRRSGPEAASLPGRDGVSVPGHRRHRPQFPEESPTQTRGDPHAECFVFLSLADELPRHDAATTLDEWTSCFCTGAGLDEQRLRRWIRVLAQAELGWWPDGNCGWGADMTHLVEALETPH